MPACVSFVLGAVLADRVPDLFITQNWAIPWLLVVFTGFLILARQRWVIQTTFWLMFLMLGAGWFNLTAMTRHNRPDDIRHLAYGQAQWVQAEIAPHAPTESRVFANIIGTFPMTQPVAVGKILIRASKNIDLPVGQVMWVYGRLSQPRQALFPGAFDEERYLLSHHATAVMHHVELAAPVRLKTGEPYPPSLMARLNQGLAGLRSQIAGAFQSALPSPLSEVLGGIVLGDHAIPVDRLTRQAFIDTGLIHVLAASGMNVAIIAGFLTLIGRALRLPFRAQLGLSIAGVAFYALLTGLPPSIQRAATMLILALFLKLRHRELTPLMLLALAIVALVLIDPMVVTSLGFRYSVLSTFGLITMMPPLQTFFENRLSPWTVWILDAFLVPFVAQLWILPLMIYHFNQFPVHSVIMNVVAVPLVAVLTCIGFCAGAMSLLLPIAGKALATMSWPFLKLLMLWIAWGQQWQNALVSMASPSAVLVLWFYALLLLLTALLHPVGRAWFVGPSGSLTRCQKISLTCGLGILTILPWSVERWQMTGKTALDIVPLSAHQAAFVANTDGGQIVMAAPASVSYWESRTLKDYLRHRNIQQIDAFFPWQSDSVKIPGNQRTLTTALSEVDIHHVADQNAQIRLGKIGGFRSSPQSLQLRLGRGFCVDLGHRGQCPIQYFTQTTRSTYRLLSTMPQLMQLRSGQFYHFEVNAQRLVVY